MEDTGKNFFEERPQHLCKMCGKCCRMSTTYIPYNELVNLQKQGDQGAIDFLEIFEPYKSIEEARQVLPDVVDNIINGLKEDNKYDKSKLTFYKCRYIGDDNLCTNYENRKNLCMRFPSSPWAVVPPGCGFENWLFVKREEAKQKVRKLKEELLELELLKQRITNSETHNKIELVIEKINKQIDMHKNHGSDNW